MPISWPWRRAAPTLETQMAAFSAGGHGEGAVALREAVREGWSPPVGNRAEAETLARFVAAAGSDRAFLLSLGGGVVRLADLARMAGAQPALADAMLPHVPALIEARPQLLAPVLGLLSGAVPIERLPDLPVPEDARTRALAEVGAGDPDPDPLTAALLGADRVAVEQAVMTMIREAGLAAAVEQLRPWTPLLAPLGLDLARTLPSSGDAVRLAIVLDDRSAAAAAAPADPELAAAAAWTAGDRTPLAALYAEWAEADGVAPRSWSGDTLDALMAGFIAPVGSASTDDRFVSVVMTAADPDPALLARAIESLLVQTHARWELLLVDDGSADPAPFAEAAARDPRIRLLATTRNGGPYLARNLALEHARGEAIAIHDADDVAHPERLRAQLARLGRGARACVMSRALRFDAAARLQLEGDGAVVGAGTMTAMFDREVFERIGPFAAVRSRGDVEFLDRIARTLGAERIETMRCPLMLAHAAPGTLSHRTRRARAGALRLFRRAYTQRRWWQTNGRWEGAGTLTVPWGLAP